MVSSCLSLKSENKADPYTGFYEIPGRLTEKEMRGILNAYRDGGTIEDLGERYGISKENLMTLLKYARAPIMYKENVDDDVYDCQ